MQKCRVSVSLHSPNHKRTTTVPGFWPWLTLINGPKVADGVRESFSASVPQSLTTDSPPRYPGPMGNTPPGPPPDDRQRRLHILCRQPNRTESASEGPLVTQITCCLTSTSTLKLRSPGVCPRITARASPFPHPPLWTPVPQRDGACPSHDGRP
jgi:hypothetical protein